MGSTLQREPGQEPPESEDARRAKTGLEEMGRRAGKVEEDPRARHAPVPGRSTACS